MDSTLKILDNGDKIYLKNGFVHREDGPAVIRKIGENLWYKDGILHREDGPAVEKTNGTKMWYKHGLLHREDGPAIKWTNGYEVFALNGIQCTYEEWHKKVDKSTCDDKIVEIDGKKYRLKKV